MPDPAEAFRQSREERKNAIISARASRTFWERCLAAAIAISILAVVVELVLLQLGHSNVGGAAALVASLGTSILTIRHQIYSREEAEWGHLRELGRIDTQIASFGLAERSENLEIAKPSLEGALALGRDVVLEGDQTMHSLEEAKIRARRVPRLFSRVGAAKGGEEGKLAVGQAQGEGVAKQKSA